ncbi:MAG: SDR family oxidoreductase [Acidimicrobiales bacterium]|nr:SDR family oxidoreductase [Acidimicrobiales bacterium]
MFLQEPQSPSPVRDTNDAILAAVPLVRRVEMSGKVVLITGGNTGIGRAAAARLAQWGATVLFTARNGRRGEKALEYVRRRAGLSSDSERVQVLPLDLASFSSIQALAARVLEDYDRLDVLVCNAGALLSEFQFTEDGFEATFGVNHLGHFLLTGLLLDRLRASAPARIVVASSIAHRAGSMRWSDIQHTVSYNGTAAYNQSKLANVLFTRELASRLDPAEVTVNCFHPGAVRTGFGSWEDTKGIERLLITIGRPFMIPPSWGARPIVYLASAPELDGVTGGYWVGGYLPGVRRRPPSRAARDSDAARRLWQLSEDMIASSRAP